MCILEDCVKSNKHLFSKIAENIIRMVWNGSSSMVSIQSVYNILQLKVTSLQEV